MLVIMPAAQNIRLNKIKGGITVIRTEKEGDMMLLIN